MAEEPKPPPPPRSAFDVRDLVVDESALTIGFTLVTYRGNEWDQAILDAGGQPVEESTSGPWLFKIQTLWQEQEAGIAFARLMRGLEIPDAPYNAAMLAIARANLPPLAVTAPEGWDWQKLYPKHGKTVRGVWAMYTAHTAQF